jgi:hypothetical protein
MLDASTASTYAGPTMHFAPTFFADNDIEFG